MKITVVMLLTVLIVSCFSSGNVGQDETVIFQFIHTGRGETFFAQTSNKTVIEKARTELKKQLEDRVLHINGALVRGSGDVNDPWSWHFKPDEWNLAELSVEVCDAWPSYIEKNLDEWMNNVGFFCPWASRVEKELHR